MAKLNSRAQVATEYLLLIGFLLMVVGVASGYALFLYHETVRVNEARTAVKLLGSAADQVFAWGSGNAVLVDVSLPAGVQEICVAGNFIRLKLSVVAGENYATALTKASLTPTCSLPTIEGVHTLKVAVEDSNVTLSEV